MLLPAVVTISLSLQAPLHTPVVKDRYSLLTKTWRIPLPVPRGERDCRALSLSLSVLQELPCTILRLTTL